MMAGWYSGQLEAAAAHLKVRLSTPWKKIPAAKRQAILYGLGEREVAITVREGRKRQVRRMAEAVGNSVAALTRIRIGSLELGELPEGEARRLGEDEVRALWEDARSMEPRR